MRERLGLLIDCDEGPTRPPARTSVIERKPVVQSVHTDVSTRVHVGGSFFRDHVEPSWTGGCYNRTLYSLGVCSIMVVVTRTRRQSRIHHPWTMPWLNAGRSRFPLDLIGTSPNPIPTSLGSGSCCWFIGSPACEMFRVTAGDGGRKKRDVPGRT